MKFWILIAVMVLILWPTIGPRKSGRQGCWYCKKGHEHGPWLNAVLCDLFISKGK